MKPSLGEVVISATIKIVLRSDRSATSSDWFGKKGRERGQMTFDLFDYLTEYLTVLQRVREPTRPPHSHFTVFDYVI